MQTLILHTMKYLESDLLVYALSREQGRQTYLLKGIRKSQRHRGACFFPMSLLEVEASPRQKGDFIYLKEFRPAPFLERLCTDVRKSAMALFMGELLYKAISYAEADTVLWDFVRNTVVELDACPAADPGLPNHHLWFATQLCCYLGYEPTDNYSRNRPCFRTETGDFQSLPPSVPESDLPLVWPESESRLLHLLLNSSQTALGTISLNGARRSAYLSLLLRYYNYHLPHPLAMRSPEVLAQTWAIPKH